MAPPRNRRPGFSRRVQIGLFFGYVVAIVGIVVSLGLVLMSRVDPQAFSAVRGASIDAGAPVTRLGKGVLEIADGIEHGLKAYAFAGSQNEALRSELAGARRKLLEAQHLKRENDRLRRTLRLIESPARTVATARIVGSSLASPRRFATLAAGTRHGVRPGQPVRTADGLVGRVLESGASASRVLLLTDPDSTVPVKIVRSGVAALIRGRGDGAVAISALLPGSRPFRRGDVVATSGTGGIFPPDIPAAVIVRVDRDTALGWPLAHPETLDFAVVLEPYLITPAASARAQAADR